MRTATGLTSRGLTVRDVGTLMGISPQRVSQLTSSAMPPQELSEIAQEYAIEILDG